MPTVFPTANPISQTDAEVQGNFFRDYEQKFAELLEQEKFEVFSEISFVRIEFSVSLKRTTPNTVPSTFL